MRARSAARSRSVSALSPSRPAASSGRPEARQCRPRFCSGCGRSRGGKKERGRWGKLPGAGPDSNPLAVARVAERNGTGGGLLTDPAAGQGLSTSGPTGAGSSGSSSTGLEALGLPLSARGPSSCAARADLVPSTTARTNTDHAAFPPARSQHSLAPRVKRFSPPCKGGQ